MKENQDTPNEKFTITYRDLEDATKFGDAFNKNLLKTVNKIRVEAPPDYQKPAAAAFTSELHSEENRLVNTCTGSPSAPVLIAWLQK